MDIINHDPVSDYMKRKRRCLFDPQVLHEIANGVIGLPPDQAFPQVIEALKEAYPGHIATRVNWVFKNAGGAMGQMAILHGSLREYVLLFGTCVGSQGHSGRYPCEVFDLVIGGEMLCEQPGCTQPEVYHAGSVAYLASGAAQHLVIPEGAWMLEYGRGYVPAMLPFAFVGSLTRTLDFKTACHTLLNYGRLVVHEILEYRKDADLVVPTLLALAAFSRLFRRGRRRR